MKIAFTGDFSFTRYFKDAYKKDDLLDENIIDFLCDSDVNVVNVEGTFTNAMGARGGLFFHYSDPQGIKWINKINGKIWNLANNHVMDCGAQGIKDTIAYAKQNGALTVGAGVNKAQASEPLIYNETVGFVSVVYDAHDTPLCSTSKKPGCIIWNKFATIKKEIELVKKKCKYCIVVAHCGDEFAKMPLPYVRDNYKKYLSFGADVIVGHHPHVVQNYERFGDKLVFYSIGNFLFDTDYQRAHKYSDEGVLLKLDIPEKKGKITFTHLPVKIDRVNTRVVKNDISPAIFTEINSKDYRKLWVVGAYNLFEEKLLLQEYVHKADNKPFCKEDWIKNKFKSNCAFYNKKLYKQLTDGINAFKKGVKTDRKEVYDYVVNSSKK